MSANATPTAALEPPSASPAASVVVEAVIVAVASTLPVRRSVGPVPIVAPTYTLWIAIATAGATAVLPFAPVFASVARVLVPVAVIVRSSAPTSNAPSAIAAFVLSLTMARAKEAPIPRSVPTPPSPSGQASTFRSEFDAALRATSLLVSVVEEPVESSARTVFEKTRTANDPATPVSPPPAPDTALRWRSEADGAVASTARSPAVRSPSACAPAVTRTTPTAMAMPTASSSEVLPPSSMTALASASTVASFAAPAWIVARPSTVTSSFAT